MDERREPTERFTVPDELELLLPATDLINLTVMSKLRLIWIRVIWNNNVEFSRLWLMDIFATAKRCAVEWKLKRTSLDASDFETSERARARGAWLCQTVLSGSLPWLTAKQKKNKGASVFFFSWGRWLANLRWRRTGQCSVLVAWAFEWKSCSSCLLVLFLILVRLFTQGPVFH